MSIEAVGYDRADLSGTYVDDGKASSLLERISDIYQRFIQDVSQYLFRKGWVITSNVLPALLGEPGESFRSAVRQIWGWKSTWDQRGFYDLGDSTGLDKLSSALQREDAMCNRIPVLLFHGLYSSPDMWIPWSQELQQAQKKRGNRPRIGVAVAK